MQYVAGLFYSGETNNMSQLLAPATYRIRDDGKGIDSIFLTSEGRTGHFGLHGMRERASLIGGTLTVWAAPGFGTEIELIIPAGNAYAASSAPWRSWLATKFFRKGNDADY